MKIIQTPPRFYPYIGGVENVTYYLSKELIKLGHQVKVICANEPAVGSGVVDGIEVERLRYIGKIANTNITPSLPRVILREDFDIIHTHLPTPWSADISAIVSLTKNKPLVLTYHNDVVGKRLYSYLAEAYNKFFLKFLLTKAQKIIITEDSYLNKSPYLLQFRKKIDTIPLGVSLEEFRPLTKKESKEKKIFFLGLLDEYHRYKGLDYLIKAMGIIKKEVPDVRLTVGGEGKLRKEYKKLVDSLNLSKFVDFLGYVPINKLIDYYNNCDVFVLPSISSVQEGFGIVLLEAMACGKPVIATDIVGPVEDIKKYNSGVIVESKNEKTLAEGIIEVLKDKHRAFEMGKRARQLVEEKYSWKKIARQTESLYFEVLR